jgi:hypothetical protein
MLMYKVGKFEDVDSFLQQVGRIQGKLKKGGVPDMVAAARIGGGCVQVVNPVVTRSLQAPGFFNP